MKTKCGKNLRDLSRWVDGELEGEIGRSLGAHVDSCDHCQKEVQSLRSLSHVLLFSKEAISVTPGFETNFWDKVSDGQATPWFTRLLNELEALVPVPNLRQAVAFAVMAFFIGNLGGIVSSVGQESPAATSPASVRHLSGLQGYKGVASYSLAGSYLSATDNKAAQ